MARVNRDQLDNWLSFGLDTSGRTIWIGHTPSDERHDNEINRQTLERFAKNLYILERLNSNPIKIMLSTPGGDLDSGMAIYSLIKNCKSHVTIYGIGTVESAGCLILQGADERVLDPWCTVMFHLGTDSHPENHPIIIEKWCEHNKRFRAKVNEMLFQKIKEKKPNLTPKKFSEMNFFDTIFMPEQAIEWNLADRVMVEGELAQA